VNFRPRYATELPLTTWKGRRAQQLSFIVSVCHQTDIRN
jgi:hypothetical protein